MVMFVGQHFLTHTTTEEALDYCLSAVSWGFLHGFLNLWREVCAWFYLLSVLKKRQRHMCNTGLQERKSHVGDD